MKQFRLFLALLLASLGLRAAQTFASFTDSPPVATDYLVGYRPPMGAAAEKRFLLSALTTYFSSNISGLTDSQINALAWSKLTGRPTTLAGYGITDSLTAAQIAAGYQPLNINLTAYAGIAPSNDAKLFLAGANFAAMRSLLGLGNVTDDAQVKRIEMGAANGVATLGVDGKVPAAQLPTDAVTSVNGKTGTVVLNSADVGLGNVTDDAQVKRIEMGAASGVATLGVDGKVPAAQLPVDAVTSVNGKTGTVVLNSTDIGLGNVTNDAQVKRIEMGAASGVATLDSLGRLLTTQLPDLAISDFLGDSANQAAMLALAGQKGDWTIRTDAATVWVIIGTDPALLTSWKELAYPAAAVTSVNGKTGTVVLNSADIGLGNVTNDAQVKRIEMGAASGVATLGVDGKVPAAQLPADAVTSVNGQTGAVVLNAISVGLGNVTNDAQVKRSEMGSANGVATLGADGKVPALQLPADAVTSVNGQTGAVVLNATSVGLSNVTNDAQVKRIEMGVANGVATLGADGKVPSGQVTPDSVSTLTGLGTGVAGALGVNVGTAGSPVVNGGAGGTPSSLTLANATGLPLTTGVTGTLPVANGGTGAASLTANNVILGNGTSAVQFVAPGTSGNVLTSNGTIWTSAAPSGGASDWATASEWRYIMAYSSSTPYFIWSGFGSTTLAGGPDGLTGYADDLRPHLEITRTTPNMNSLVGLSTNVFAGAASVQLFRRSFRVVMRIAAKAYTSSHYDIVLGLGNLSYTNLDSNTNNIQFRRTSASGNWFARVCNATNGGVSYDTGTSYGTGTTVTLAIEYNVGASVKFYINGTLVATSTSTTNFPAVTENVQLHIGSITRDDTQPTTFRFSELYMQLL